MSALEPGFVDRLEQEFARVAAHARPRPRRRVAVIAAASLALLTGGAALAVTSVLDPRDPTTGLATAQDPAVVLTGSDSSGRPWQLVVADEDDSFCMSLRSGDVPNPAPTAGVQCGGITPGTLEATVGGVAGLVHGTLPEDAATVTLTGRDGTREAVVGDEAGRPGKFFVGEIPPGEYDSPEAYRDVTVTVRDAAGTVVAQDDLRALVVASSPY